MISHLWIAAWLYLGWIAIAHARYPVPTRLEIAAAWLFHGPLVVVFAIAFFHEFSRVDLYWSYDAFVSIARPLVFMGGPGSAAVMAIFRVAEVRLAAKGANP